MFNAIEFFQNSYVFVSKPPILFLISSSFRTFFGVVADAIVALTLFGFALCRCSKIDFVYEIVYMGVLVAVIFGEAVAFFVVVALVRNVVALVRNRGAAFVLCLCVEI